MTTYAPKTLLRLYDEDTHICTAVVLKTGEVLEVKNYDGAPKKTYESFESWKAERGAELQVRADTTNASGSVTGKPDANGFIDHCGYAFTQWLLKMMNEGTPHLLKNEAVRDAFNNLTATVHKYSDVLTPNRSHYTGFYKYYIDNMQVYTLFGGFPVHVSARPMPADYGEEAIKTAYKALFVLIGPDVKAYVKKKSDQIQAASDLKHYQKMAAKFTYRSKRLARELHENDMKLVDIAKRMKMLEEILKN